MVERKDDEFKCLKRACSYDVNIITNTSRAWCNTPCDIQPVVIAVSFEMCVMMTIVVVRAEVVVVVIVVVVVSGTAHGIVVVFYWVIKYGVILGKVWSVVPTSRPRSLPISRRGTVQGGPESWCREPRQAGRAQEVSASHVLVRSRRFFT